MYIYKTTNLLNGLYYIGKRKRNTKKDRKEYFGSGIIINRAIKKYKKENFKKEILMDNIMEKHELDYFETFWIKILCSQDREYGYNLGDGGEGGGHGSGWKHTEEAKRKISIAGKNISDETRKKMSKSKKGMIPWNKGLTKETDERVRKYGENESKTKINLKYNKILRKEQNETLC